MWFKTFFLIRGFRDSEVEKRGARFREGLHRRLEIANILGMDFHFVESFPRAITRVDEVWFTYRVTRIEKSGSGFKTPIQTIRICGKCRVESMDRTGHEDRYLESGVEPYPIATWLLTGEPDQWSPTPSIYETINVITAPKTRTLALCSDHFKAMRERIKSDRGVPLDPSQTEARITGESLMEAFQKTGSVPEHPPLTLTVNRIPRA